MATLNDYFNNKKIDTKNRNFQNSYEKIPYADLMALEEERKAVKERWRKSFYITAIFTACYVFLMWFLGVNVGFAVYSTIILAIVVCFFSDRIGTTKLKPEFKDNVIAKMIKLMNPNFEYYKNEFISRDEFETTEIFYTSLDSDYGGDDLIVGEYKGVKFKTSDVECSGITTKLTSKGPNVNTFYGIVFIAEFNKFFTSRTFVSSIIYAEPKGDKITVDNVEFNNTFEIYTDDKVNAFYILSPSLMEKLLRLKKRFKGNIVVAFVDNKIYIYIDDRRDNFEVDINQTIELVYHAHKERLQSILQIIDELNLNSKVFKPNLDKNSANSSENSTQNSAG